MPALPTQVLFSALAPQLLCSFKTMTVSVYLYRDHSSLYWYSHPLKSIFSQQFTSLIILNILYFPDALFRCASSAFSVLESIGITQVTIQLTSCTLTVPVNIQATGSGTAISKCFFSLQYWTHNYSMTQYYSIERNCCKFH